VESLLDVARITAGRLTLEPEDVDLAKLARDVTERFGDDALRAGCKLRVEADEAVVGSWDRLRVEQVLTNLVSNAIKYAPGKPVDIKVTRDAKKATLTVTDHGIGIASDSLVRIFGRFERAVPTRHYGGLGMGLYITREIVEAHGGQVRVVSEPGQGATFIVELPCETPRRTLDTTVSEVGPEVHLEVQ
jgi:signal transduction histidine kinase